MAARPCITAESLAHAHDVALRTERPVAPFMECVRLTAGNCFQVQWQWLPDVVLAEHARQTGTDSASGLAEPDKKAGCKAGFDVDCKLS